MTVLELDKKELDLSYLRSVDDQKKILAQSTHKLVEKTISKGGYNWKKKVSEQKTIEFGMPLDNPFYHTSYLKYLEIAWQCHCPIVFTPDVFWFTVMNELSGHVRGNASHYESVFADPKTAKGEKKEIVVPAKTEVLDVDAIADQIENICPVDPTIFYPEFSTTTAAARFAMKATFLETVSPWYCYGMLACGIPMVRVDGSKEDWMQIAWQIDTVLKRINPLPNFQDYLKRMGTLAGRILESISKGDADFWKEIFWAKSCGSGSQIEFKGWFTNMFLKPPSMPTPDNFPTHVPSVDYKIYPMETQYSLHVGIFTSQFDKDGFMVPEFGYVANRFLDKGENNAE